MGRIIVIEPDHQSTAAKVACGSSGDHSVISHSRFGEVYFWLNQVTKIELKKNDGSLITSLFAEPNRPMITSGLKRARFYTVYHKLSGTVYAD